MFRSVFRRRGWRLRAERLADRGKRRLLVPRREPAVVADLLEPGWQDVEQEAADEVADIRGLDSTAESPLDALGVVS